MTKANSNRSNNTNLTNQKKLVVRPVHIERSAKHENAIGMAQLPPPKFTNKNYRNRTLKWMLVCILLILLSIPFVTWLQYQSSNIISRNAIVRGNLAEIGTRINGVLMDIDVPAGEKVWSGQVLAKLEHQHIKAEGEEAKAELEGFARELEVEQMAIEHEKLLLQNKIQEAGANLAAAQAEVTAAKTRAREAENFYQARKKLLSEQLISREDVRDANSKRRTAAALVRVAEANYLAAKSAQENASLDSDGLLIRKQRIGVLEANVARAKARLAKADADLQGTHIRAPGDGVVIRWLIQQGGSVEVGKPVLSMWVGDEVWIEAWIDEDEISHIQVGDIATVTLQSFPGKEFMGVVEKIGLTTDFQTPAPDIPQPRFTRMRGAPVIGVLVRLNDPPDKLLPGLSAVVAIQNSVGG